MKSAALLSLLLLTPCGLTSCGKGANAQTTTSALYDPPFVTLKEGTEYQFGEGSLAGRGQKFFSQAVYMRAALDLGK